jgi:hypothetical protein
MGHPLVGRAKGWALPPHGQFTVVPGDAARNGATIAAFGDVAHTYVFIEDTARGSTTALAYTDLAVPSTVKRFASGAPLNNRRIRTMARVRTSPRYRKLTRLVESFAYPSSAKNAEGWGTPFVGRDNAASSRRALGQFSRGRKRRPPCPAFAPEVVDGGQTRDYYHVLPSGFQAICLRAVILDRWRESA